MNRLNPLLILLMISLACISQEYQPYRAPYKAPAKKTKVSKITLQTFDGINYKGNLISIGYDYLLIDAKKYNSPAKLRPYYVRPLDDYYRFDVEYLKSATMTRGRSVGINTLQGLIAGVFVAGLITYGAIQGEVWFDSFGEWAILSGFTIGIGTLAGFVTGLVRQKKILIDGNPNQLNKLHEFYNP